MADISSKVKTVIEVLHDGEKGFADLGEHFKDSAKKAFFMNEASTRKRFATELESAAGAQSEIGGTAVGSLHRSWGDLKAKMGGGDHALLETAEQGEDAAKKAYQEALDDKDTTSSVRDLLAKQQAHIQESHDKVKAWRDSTK